MVDRRRSFSGTSLERTFGYARAIRCGDRIIVSGCAPLEPDGIAQSDAGAQANRCFEIIAQAVNELGGSMDDVVRTRIYLVDRADLGAVMAAHRNWVGRAQPAATAVIAALIDPSWKVEIEAEAVVATSFQTP